MLFRRDVPASERLGFRTPWALISAGHLHISGNVEKIEALAAHSALSQESRLDMFRLLVQAGESGLAAGYIGDRLGLPSATLSFHLSQLRHAGLITFRREGRSLVYMAEYAAMDELLGFLMANCCQGEHVRCNCDIAPAVPTKEGKCP